ncbi:hypothetical protein KW795_00080 [Candidatus Microgenomates bacterium]|nr:hypothetical protein [Candidatus Microgenomates bacterium]
MIFLLISFVNLWLYKIASFNIVIAVLVLAISFLVLNSYRRNKVYVLLIVLFIILSIVQIRTTNVKSLINLSEDQKVSQTRRVRQYPPVYINFLGKTIWIPVAHWFEERKEYRVLDRLGKNFSEILDPNLYFFASHPRETDQIESFEKFAYILLPIFIIGFVKFLKSKNVVLLVLTLVVPILISTIIGTRNPIGPITLFPLFTLSIYLGLGFVYQKINQKNKTKVVIGFGILYLLVFIQTVIYAIN